MIRCRYCNFIGESVADTKKHEDSIHKTEMYCR